MPLPFFLLTILQVQVALVSSDWTYPPSGLASLTHYSLPLDYIASCGCAGASTHYPTTALSQFAYGSASAYGPACGQCFNLTLLNTFLSSPPWYPSDNPSIIIKVTDLCPIAGTWCSGTDSKPNPAGHILNFDLAFPSPAIPSDFFPANVSYYGYSDFGVWNISYESVPCTPNWAGSDNPSAMGSVDNLGDSVCCPGDPSANLTCPSFSEANGIPPDTAIGSSTRISAALVYTLALAALATVVASKL